MRSNPLGPDPQEIRPGGPAEPSPGLRPKADALGNQVTTSLRPVRPREPGPGEPAPVYLHSRRGLDVLPDDPRMPSCDAQQSDRAAFRMPPPLLPIAESANADSHRESELHLCQADEAPQGGDVLAR